MKYLGDVPPQTIEVRVLEENGLVHFEVEDNGPGIPPHLSEKIFDPHVRAHGTTKPGIGLGLATVKRLALAHGGEVGVRPKPERGSVFWFKLPRTDLP
jgi:signal transduction histidine kinase